MTTLLLCHACHTSTNLEGQFIAVQAVKTVAQLKLSIPAAFVVGQFNSTQVPLFYNPERMRAMTDSLQNNKSSLKLLTG